MTAAEPHAMNPSQNGRGFSRRTQSLSVRRNPRPSRATVGALPMTMGWIAKLARPSPHRAMPQMAAITATAKTRVESEIRNRLIIPGSS
jgi:hypothetical protein